MEFIARITGFMLISSVFFNILPENSIKSYVKRASGFIMIIIILGGIRDKISLDSEYLKFEIIEDEENMERNITEQGVKRMVKMGLENSNIKCENIRLVFFNNEVRKIVIDTDREGKNREEEIEKIVASLIMIEVDIEVKE